MVKQELAAIQEACDEFQLGYRPNFVVVIVTKRHNKRFLKSKIKLCKVLLFRLLKEGPNGSLLGSGNPDALTVVDTAIVRTDLTEFYVQTHNAIQVSIILLKDFQEPTFI